MGQTALGFLLQRLREERGLSFRELMQLAKVDHAYIYRLETGDKESPSEEALSKLVKALKAGKRETGMLRYLAEHGETDVALVDHVLGDPAVTLDEFTAVAGMNFRGQGRPDFARQIAMVRRVMGEGKHDG
jgi:transcriptional regulator with XRE-family HTH domain